MPCAAQMKNFKSRRYLRSQQGSQQRPQRGSMSASARDTQGGHMSLQGIDVLPTIPRRSPRWLLALALLILTGYGCRFIASNVFHYFNFDSATYYTFWPRRFGLIPHIFD